jgi:hypothetical protein
MAWIGANDLGGDKSTSGGSDALEKKHRALVEHEQACSVCLITLGKAPVQAIGANLQKETNNKGPATRKRKPSKPQPGALVFPGMKSLAV